ncbi:MAG: hypothetical protein KIT27_09160 [Legionellales bacterium]|nr:hypothetical protein [Legionellales bacterium]
MTRLMIKRFILSNKMEEYSELIKKTQHNIEFSDSFQHIQLSKIDLSRSKNHSLHLPDSELEREHHFNTSLSLLSRVASGKTSSIIINKMIKYFKAIYVIMKALFEMLFAVNIMRELVKNWSDYSNSSPSRRREIIFSLLVISIIVVAVACFLPYALPSLGFLHALGGVIFPPLVEIGVLGFFYQSISKIFRSVKNYKENQQNNCEKPDAYSLTHFEILQKIDPHLQELNVNLQELNPKTSPQKQSLLMCIENDFCDRINRQYVKQVAGVSLKALELVRVGHDDKLGYYQQAFFALRNNKPGMIIAIYLRKVERLDRNIQLLRKHIEESISHLPGYQHKLEKSYQQVKEYFLQAENSVHRSSSSRYTALQKIRHAKKILKEKMVDNKLVTALIDLAVYERKRHYYHLILQPLTHYAQKRENAPPGDEKFNLS